MTQILFVLTRQIFDGRHFERCDVVATTTSVERAMELGQKDFDNNFTYTNGGEPLKLTWSHNTESDRELLERKSVTSPDCDPIKWEIHRTEIQD